MPRYLSVSQPQGPLHVEESSLWSNQLQARLALVPMVGKRKVCGDGGADEWWQGRDGLPRGTGSEAVGANGRRRREVSYVNVQQKGGRQEGIGGGGMGDDRVGHANPGAAGAAAGGGGGGVGRGGRAGGKGGGVGGDGEGEGGGGGVRGVGVGGGGEGGGGGGGWGGGGGKSVDRGWNKKRGR